MKFKIQLFTVSLVVLLSACVPAAESPTPTLPPASSTPVPTETIIPSPTLVPATSTPIPQQLLLRRRCGRDYMVDADKPIQLFYGGWGVLGLELAAQWSSAYSVDLTIDEQTVKGELQRATLDLPLNCQTGEDIYWLYYMTILPGLTTGDHHVRVRFNSSRALPDGTGPTYGPGPMEEQTFVISTR